jgi:hypothetical protein
MGLRNVWLIIKLQKKLLEYNMEKLLALLDLFRKGNACADPAKWKSHQVTATMLAVAIIAFFRMLKAFGYGLPIDEDSATAISGGIIAIANVLFTYTTSDKIGLLQPKTGNEAGGVDSPQPSVVQTEVGTIVSEKAVKLISETYLQEAREALAKRDSEAAREVNTGA